MHLLDDRFSFTLNARLRALSKHTACASRSMESVADSSKMLCLVGSSEMMLMMRVDKLNWSMSLREQRTAQFLRRLEVRARELLGEHDCLQLKVLVGALLLPLSGQS